jgi:hypothetical protein
MPITDGGPVGDHGIGAGRQSMSADRRDKKLGALLPSKNAPYDYKRLSKAETDALVEALGDGFGDVLVADRSPFPLPSNVKSGLLDHSFHCPPNSTYDPEEHREPFWTSTDSDDGAPAAYEWFPLGFSTRRLGIYFENQFDRFCEQLVRETPEAASLDRFKDRYVFEHQAASRLYEKPWYELHALQFLAWIKMSTEDAPKHPVLTSIFIGNFGGELGRLVEQYHWRFRFEDAATTGIGARKGAAAGGQAKAKRDQAEHSKWQKIASEIWARRPDLTKSAVCEQVRRQLSLDCTRKHIARYIDRL